jgi:hypothetical protein
MLTIEEAFNLIKKERKFLNDITEYKIKISNSNNFERENMIGVYTIRKYNAHKNGNFELSQQMETLVSNLKNYSGNKLRFITVLGQEYYGMFFLSQDWNKIIGYIETEANENMFSKKE